MKKIRIAAVCIAAVLVCLAACKSGETPEKGSPKSPGPTVESAQSAPQKTETAPEPEKTPETAPAPLQEQEQPPQTPEPAVNPATSFTRMSYKELVADDGSREELKELPKDDGYTVEVDLTNCIVTVFAKDGSTALQALCTVGKKETPTPAGEFKMGSQRERFGYFKKYDCYAQYWSQIDGEIFFHSVLYHEPDEDTLIKTTYRNLGRATSHGCVRLTVPDAKWIYENVGVGSKVIIREKEKDKALKDSLKLPKAG